MGSLCLPSSVFSARSHGKACTLAGASDSARGGANWTRYFFIEGVTGEQHIPSEDYICISSTWWYMLERCSRSSLFSWYSISSTRGATQRDSRSRTRSNILEHYIEYVSP